MDPADDCGGLSLFGGPCIDPLGSVTGAVTGSILDQIASSVAEFLGSSLEWVLSWWSDRNVPDLESTSSASGAMRELLGPYTFYLAVLGVILAGAKMIWDARQGAVVAKDVLSSMVLMVLGTAAAVPTIQLAAGAADSAANYILEETTGGAGEAFVDLYSNMGEIAVIGFILLGILLALISLGIGVTMLLRTAALVVIAAVVPLAFATVLTQSGKQWVRTLFGWVLAFILYKPVAAIILGVGLRMIQQFSEEASFTSFALALAVFFLALTALPALMKLIVPAVTPASGSMSGSSVAGSLATGAAIVAVGAATGGAGLAAGGGAAAAGGASAGSAGTGAGATGAGASSAGASGASGTAGGGSAASGVVGGTSSSTSTGGVGPSGAQGGSGMSGSTGSGGPSGSDGSSGFSGGTGSSGPSGADGSSGSDGASAQRWSAASSALNAAQPSGSDGEGDELV